jgi:hypothetical protein
VPRDDLINAFRIARNAVASSQDGRPEPRFGVTTLDEAAWLDLAAAAEAS